MGTLRVAAVAVVASACSTQLASPSPPVSLAATPARPRLATTAAPPPRAVPPAPPELAPTSAHLASASARTSGRLARERATDSAAATPLAVEPPPRTPSCPEEMALVWRHQGPYCIDRWEASLVRVRADGSTVPHPFNRSVDGIEAEVRAVSRKGVRPQGYISGAQAARACANAGKRLCEVDEWVRACRGPRLTRYPYGDQRQANVCNDRFRVLDRHPVPILWKKDPLDPTNEQLMWHPRFMNDERLLELPHTTSPTGAFARCTNEHGVYDMVGNLHEWVNDPEGTFFGGFFMDTFQNGEGCEYRTLGHPFDYHDYSTGFRCCADAT